MWVGRASHAECWTARQAPHYAVFIVFFTIIIYPMLYTRIEGSTKAVQAFYSQHEELVTFIVYQGILSETATQGKTVWQLQDAEPGFPQWRELTALAQACGLKVS